MSHIHVPEQHSANPTAAVRALSPTIYGAATAFSMTVYRNVRLPHRVIEAARMRTAQINGCLSCQTWRAAEHLEATLTQAGDTARGTFIDDANDPAPDNAFYAAIDADWRQSSVFSERERLAIEHAERMGENPHSFGDDDAYWTRMHAAFSDQEIVELTCAIASWISGGRIAHTLGVDPPMCEVRLGTSTAAQPTSNAA
jgi:alkylhydroperoxidase family enzyme